MHITPHILLGSGRLEQYTGKITSAFTDAVERAQMKVEISRVDVVIYDNLPGVIPEIGVGGYTPDEYTIFISLDPSFPNFDQVIADELGRTLTHELHHTLRWKNPGYGETLLEALITEGLADHFDLEVNGEDPEPWSIALNPDQLEEMLQRARREFATKQYDHTAWFFGSEEPSIPKWTGYSLGYYLVDEYLKKNPTKKPSTIFSLKAEEFV